MGIQREVKAQKIYAVFLKKNPIRSDLSILVTGDVLFSWKQQGMFNSVSPVILNENKSQLNYLREEK